MTIEEKETYELWMKNWDRWRKYIAEGGKASFPRDEFEQLLSDYVDTLSKVKRLEREIEIRKSAVDRWVPCPDHRDKIEKGKCYVCENERLREGISEVMDGTLPYLAGERLKKLLEGK